MYKWCAFVFEKTNETLPQKEVWFKLYHASEEAFYSVLRNWTHDVSLKSRKSLFFILVDDFIWVSTTVYFVLFFNRQRGFTVVEDEKNKNSRYKNTIYPTKKSNKPYFVICISSPLAPNPYSLKWHFQTDQEITPSLWIKIILTSSFSSCNVSKSITIAFVFFTQNIIYK